MPEPEANNLHPPTTAIAELHPLLARFALVVEKRPDQSLRCMVELGTALEIVSKAIRRGSIDQNQLIDLRRRVTFMEKQVND